MAYVPVPSVHTADLHQMAERRWDALRSSRPDLAPAVALQRDLLATVMQLAATLEGRPRPRLSLPPRYVAAKLARGVPALAGEPVPLPVPVLTPALLNLCDALAAGGAADAATHIRDAVASGNMESGSLLTASFKRDQPAIRLGATHRGLAPDLVWLVAELAVSPFIHLIQRSLFEGSEPDALPSALQEALGMFAHGYCPACGSWPAVAEVVAGHRTLRCSFCAAAWELPTYACIYCGEKNEAFVTAAPNEERKDRRVELCRTCGGYLKTIDLDALSPFPLLAISDIETTDLDVAAMEHGYARPQLKTFGPRAGQG
jgi:FdhE protein